MTYVVQNPHASFQVQVVEAHQQENQPKILQIGVPGLSQRAIGAEDPSFVHQSLELLTDPKENFQETVSASHIIRNVNLMLGIDQADHIKEVILIQKADHVGNLMVPKENFQETVSASLIIRSVNQLSVNRMLGIDLADLIKEETQIQKADHVGNLTDLRENFQETVSASLIIRSVNHMLGIDLADLIKEAIQIQKADHVGNLTDLKENFQETARVSLIISHTHQTERQILEKEIESQDHIKEAIQIQKADLVGNLTDPKENFQETVSASPLIRSVNHTRGIDLTELFKEAN